MFDLRYHVASLTAVFVALVIGILVGVGLSGKGFVNDAERANLTRQIADLQQQRRRGAGSRSSRRVAVEQALKRLRRRRPTRRSFPGRLEGKRVAVLFVGPVDRGVVVRRRQGGARRGRHGRPHAVDRRAARHEARSQEALRRQPAFRQLAGRRPARRSRYGARGRARGRRQDAALGCARRDHRAGARRALAAPPADAVVVVRTAEPQRGADEGVPRGRLHRARAIGSAGRRHRGLRHGPSAIPAFALAGLSTVDSVDTVGRPPRARAAPRRRRAGQLRRQGDRHATASCLRSPRRRRQG